MLENGDVWMGKTTHIERKLFKWRKTAWEQERQEIIKTLKRYKHYKKNDLYLRTKTVTINKKSVGKCMIDFVLPTFLPSTLRGV